MKITLRFLFVMLFSQACISAKSQPPAIRPGAAQTDQYLPLIKGKKLAVFANHTALIGQTHLVDSLRSLGADIRVIFAPEHGFRGDADAGEKVASTTDPRTGIPIVSLYGSRNKPTAEDLADVDIMIFDIQDVGVRFYTYISSLEYYMEAAIEHRKPLIVLDRPNPNGFYIDGPILQRPFRSFVGMQPVPIVYGMTMGEYALMLVGERMLRKDYADKLGAKPEKVSSRNYNGFLTVIPCSGYDHTMTYELPVAPSPNLPNHQSILLYPSTCFFEGTDLSLGRGTDKPFQVYGHPSLPKNLYSFTPQSVKGATNPPQLGNTCYGADLSKEPIDIRKPEWQRIQLRYLMDAYRLFPNKDQFWLRPRKNNPRPEDFFFNKLAGNAELMRQIINGRSEAEIRKSWEPGIAAFKPVRRKYLLYKDFE